MQTVMDFDGWTISEVSQLSSYRENTLGSKAFVEKTRRRVMRARIASDPMTPGGET